MVLEMRQKRFQGPLVVIYRPWTPDENDYESNKSKTARAQDQVLQTNISSTGHLTFLCTVCLSQPELIQSPDMQPPIVKVFFHASQLDTTFKKKKKKLFSALTQITLSSPSLDNFNQKHIVQYLAQCCTIQTEICMESTFLFTILSTGK